MKNKEKLTHAERDFWTAINTERDGQGIHNESFRILVDYSDYLEAFAVTLYYIDGPSWEQVAQVSFKKLPKAVMWAHQFDVWVCADVFDVLEEL